MVLNNLRKTVEYYRQQLSSTTNTYTQKLGLLKGLPFYCEWIPNNIPRPKNGLCCCFNHVIGLPRKDGIEFPLFDYELQLFNALAKHKYIWVKKASGLGITEFMLRYMAWLATKDDTYRNAQFPIVCGPNQDIAIKLIKRIKLMFESLQIYFAQKKLLLN